MFALEDEGEGGRWDYLKQLRRLSEQSLRTSMNIVTQDMTEAFQVRATFLWDGVIPLFYLGAF